MGLVWSATVCLLQHEGQLDRDLLLKADSEWLQTSMPEAGFKPDYSTEWQHSTIWPSPGNKSMGESCSNSGHVTSTGVIFGSNIFSFYQILQFLYMNKLDTPFQIFFT
jgi:hypothetical protein